MIVRRSLADVEHDPNSVVTVGTFDGVHLGHQAIVRELVGRAHKRGGRSVVITFEPHPREVVGRGPVKWLTSIEERIALMDGLALDLLLILEFTYEFSRQTSREFFERYVFRGVGVAEMIVGHDHMFGRDREAGNEELRAMGQELGFAVETLDPTQVRGEVVSSSRIREMLLRGDVATAREFLGRAYSFEGVVVRGDLRGTLLGFPTANVEPSFPNQIIPAEGVYVVEVNGDANRRHGMMNIGIRPTFKTEYRRVIEVHLFDFDGALYGRRLRISPLKRLRPERKFASKEELIAQLHRDREESMKFITALQPS